MDIGLLSDPVGIPISVITTDYTNYAIIYGCKSNLDTDIKYISAWILSRTTTLDPETLNKARLELNSIPYASAVYLEPVDQRESKCNAHWTAHIQAVNVHEDSADQ
ncbi:hypothetical protein MSG28_006754 [Choristoneura fumiferana]|uniref:Uncharacterized protein n=1 Tax=Choristoneura fumiferana TaxID=7141 RepID=A0ACC0JLU1_CHOFU|nr:hypothetical protein MSG28_006754 [Choristoneura fumiferana]